MSRAMKDSGIPWIGEIPKDWNVNLIGSCIKEVDCKNTNCNEDNALQFKMGTIISKRNGDSKYNPETLEAYNIVKVGDIIINGLNLSFDLISQRVGLVKENGVITSTYIAVRPTTNISNEFLTYLFKAYDNCKAFHSMGRGLRQTLSYGELRKYYVVLPFKEEQQRIAEFLDRKCGEIDEAIALQEEFIEELKAYKQSVITETVTRGLNPNVKFKDSSIDWIGEIPQEWEVVLLQSLAVNVRNGYVGPTRNLFKEDGVKYIQSLHLKDGIIDFGRRSYFVSDEWAKVHPKIHTGDLLIVQTGDIGQVAVVTNEYDDCNCHALIILTPNAKICMAQYICYYLRSVVGKELLLQCKTGALLPHLNSGKIGVTPITLPPYEEQLQIIRHLDQKCIEIDSLIAIKQQKIEELKDYKKSIIYEYVTGKKEVNG